MLFFLIYLVNINDIFTKSCRNSRVRFLGIFACKKASTPAGTRVPALAGVGVQNIGFLRQVPGYLAGHVFAFDGI
jgi:hypothetical protein